MHMFINKPKYIQLKIWNIKLVWTVEVRVKSM